MEIVHVYQKKRREFGRQCHFSDRHAKLIVDIEPDASLREDYIYKNPSDVAVQCSSEFSEHEAITFFPVSAQPDLFSGQHGSQGVRRQRNEPH